MTKMKYWNTLGGKSDCGKGRDHEGREIEAARERIRLEDLSMIFILLPF